MNEVKEAIKVYSDAIEADITAQRKVDNASKEREKTLYDLRLARHALWALEQDRRI